MSERIEINPRVCGGQPIIKGTCISVSAILEQLADSESWDFPLARSSETDAGRYLGGLAVGPAFYSTSTHRDHRSRRGVKRRAPTSTKCSGSNLAPAFSLHSREGQW